MTDDNADIEASSLKHAIEIASAAHRGQVNKANEPYILHPMRVMDRVDFTDEKIVAILHDVVEKNQQWSLGRLASEGFKPKVVEAVDAMTRRAWRKLRGFCVTSCRQSDQEGGEACRLKGQHSYVA